MTICEQNTNCFSSIFTYKEALTFRWDDFSSVKSPTTCNIKVRDTHIKIQQEYKWSSLRINVRQMLKTSEVLYNQVWPRSN